jgi:hypothetical protein
MTTISEKSSKSNAVFGILHPLLNYQFVVRYDHGLLTTEAAKLLCTQTIKFSLDMKNQEFTLYLQQPVGYANEFFIILSDITSPSFGGQPHISIGTLDHTGEFVPMLKFVSVECIESKFELSYEEQSTPSTHVLKFKYKREGMVVLES